MLQNKTLHNSDASTTTSNVPDVKFFGNGNTFKLIAKASSEAEGWMKSTKAMEIQNAGCVVQTTTQQRNINGTYSLTDALVFVPDVVIEETFDNDDCSVVSRRLVHKSLVGVEVPYSENN
jgi:hypothetical protein